MTSPVIVGEVAVEITAHVGAEFTRALRRSINRAVRQANLGRALTDGITRAIRDADLGKALRDALPKQPIKVPVRPEVVEAPAVKPADTTTRHRGRREPAPEVDPDPVLRALQQDIRRQIRDLSRQALQIPVNADTDPLREQIAAALRDLSNRTRAQIPTDPADRRDYERQLRTLVSSVAAQVRAAIPVDVSKPDAIRQARAAANAASAATPPVRLGVDIDRNRLRQAIAAFGGLATAARGAVTATAGLAGIATAVGAGATALAGLAAAAGAAVQALGAIAAAAVTASGALAAIPGAVSIAAAAVGALALGFMGIKDALKESTKASSGAANAVSGLAAAERAYQAALRESKRAQEALNRARREAVERLEDLDRALRGAQLDEREAALRLVEAEQELARARRYGTYLDIQRAQLAYEQAALAVENAKDRVEDLTAEQQEAVKKGVEGSDLVQAALDRQLAAADSLAAAQERLAQAQQKAAGRSSAAAQAMARLAPAAREVVRTLLALQPAWEDMQRAVQQQLFAGVAQDLRELSASILPSVRAGLVGVAGVLNTQIRAAIDQLSTAETRIRLDQIFANTETTLDNFTSGIKPLIRALLDVAEVGSKVIADITKGAGDSIKRFADQISAMAESGQLEQIINAGIDVLKQLGRAAADVAGIFKGIFSAADAAGGSGIFGLLDRLNELVNSAAGQTALTRLFESLGRIGDALMPVLLALGQALAQVAEAVGDIAVAFAPSLTELVLSLGSALASLTPAFTVLTPLIRTIASGLEPLATIITNLVTAAAPGLNAFLQGLVAGLEALVPAAAPVGQALGAIARALAPLLPLIGQVLADVLTAAATLLSGVAAALGPLIKVVSEAATTFAAQFLPVLQKLARQLLPVLINAGIEIARAFAPLIPVIAEVGQIIAERLALALPSLIAAFVKLVPYVAQFATTLGQTLLTALEMLMPHLPELIDSGLKLAIAFTQLTLAIAPFLPQLIEIGLLLLQAALNSGLLELSLNAMIAVLNIVSPLISSLSGLLDNAQKAFGKVKEAVGKMSSAASDGIRSTLDKIKEIPGKITSALGDMGNLLYRAGRNVVQGLIDGIKSMFGALGSTASSLAGTIRDYLPFSPAKKGPLSGRGNPYFSGQSISRLVAEGVRANLGVVSDAAGDLAGRFSGPLAVNLPSLGGVSATQLAAPEPTTVYAEWVGGVGDPIIRALREHIRIYYGGSAQLAIGTGLGRA